MNNIVNEIEDDFDYEFFVIVKRKDGDYEWIKNFEDAEKAYQLANEIGGTVGHNVRIAGKQPRKNKILINAKLVNKCVFKENEEGYYVPQCLSEKDKKDTDLYLDWATIRHFNQCPYCGKKIITKEFY